MKKTYVITGATSGIGNELVKRLASEHNVFAGYRNPDLAEDLKQLGAIPFYIDMEKPETIKEASDFILSKIDSIDTMINVAGCVIAGIMETLPVETVKRQFEVNTFSHLDFTQRLLNGIDKYKNNSPLPSGEGAVLRELANGRNAGEGINLKVINISSMASFGIFPFVSPYCASKRALDILFNALALESDIKVISIKPGVIATPLWDKSIELNKYAIENCKNHEREMKYMVGNARRNGHRGLKAGEVADFIIKIDALKNPKPSYTIGFDAKMAEIFSKLPFGIQNNIVKLGMKLRIK